MFVVSDLSNIFRFMLKLLDFYFLLCLGRQISQMVPSLELRCLETGQLPVKNSNLSSLLMSNVKTRKRKGKTKKYREQSTLNQKVNETSSTSKYKFSLAVNAQKDDMVNDNKDNILVSKFSGSRYSLRRHKKNLSIFVVA